MSRSGLIRRFAVFHVCCAIATVSAAAADWRLVRSIPADEAVQAAAADETHLYAIAGNRIARYNRESGQRTATSRGEAHHLNSGFLWEGKLYCAHSNYPRVPEQSEIMVLDPQSMELTTHRNFGNFGGSLTWVLRTRDRWWCNFARYGDANHETFLVEFDLQWNELRRFTYPPELISQLGRYSLSGGIWRGDELLATDHDHGRLYRLQLPTEGTVMTYLGNVAAPMTGQGIAADPQTGGLIGINRAKKQILLLEEISK